MRGWRATERNPLDLIEEAARLLRGAPAGLLGLYYVGSAPFVLAFLFFWADMSASPFAPGRLLWVSGLMALLYLWMKSWQAAFVIGLRRHFNASGGPDWTAGRVLRLMAAQAAIQPSGLLLTPLSLCLLLPFPFVFAFYQNAGAREAGFGETFGAALRRTARQSAAAPGRNAGLIALFGLLAVVVLANVVTGLLFLPSLLKIFTGEEMLFTRDLSTAFNTTFLAIAAGITYLCVDPVVRAAYFLRGFYAESSASGEDLRLELQSRLLAKTALALLVGGLLVLPLGAASARGDEGTVPAPVSTPAGELNREAFEKALRQTLKRNEFAWRLPKDSRAAPEKPKGIIAQFFSDILDQLAALRRSVWRWVKSWFRRADPAPASSGGRFGGGALNTFLTLMLLIGAALLALWFWRWLATRRAVPSAAVSVIPAQPAPDLEDESARPDALPSDEWMRLALEMAASGNGRLALRAYYLAGLAHLAAKDFIRVARFKSNLDYANELHRRTKANPGLAPVFRENVDQFDRAWYGRHPVDAEILSRFEANTKALCSC
jgi:hypothetical protein